MQRIILEFILEKQLGDPFSREEIDLVAKESAEVARAVVKKLQAIYPWLRLSVAAAQRET